MFGKNKTVYYCKINYLSGNSIEGWFEYLELSPNEIKWECYGNWKVLKINLDQIESVVQLKHKKVRS